MDKSDGKCPQYGLMPPGALADRNAFFYYFSLNGYYYAGLRSAAAALTDVGEGDGKSLLQESVKFKQDILSAYKWTQERYTVLPLRDGTWVTGYPSQLFAFAPLQYYYPREDIKSWCYDIELGAHQMVPQGIIDQDSPDVTTMLEQMEDGPFLADGMNDYPAKRNEKDWFDYGGFAKVQPYYCRNAEIYAMRNDVKPFIRSYFNTIASMVSAENLSFWEHFNNFGAWNKTHETGYFLQQTRFMLVMEQGNDLWLAPLVTNNWLKDGMVVSIKNAPTRFGNVSYIIKSEVNKGYIEANVEPPTRQSVASIILRIRHPDGKPIKSVTVDGVKHKGFDPSKETITIRKPLRPFTVWVEY